MLFNPLDVLHSSKEDQNAGGYQMPLFQREELQGLDKDPGMPVATWQGDIHTEVPDRSFLPLHCDWILFTLRTRITGGE